jgi:hypothetical protein
MAMKFASMGPSAFTDFAQRHAFPNLTRANVRIQKRLKQMLAR